MIELHDLWTFVPMLLVGGAFAGILAGLLGIGGGIVLVPILYHLFTLFGVDASLAMPMSVATSLSTIIFTSTISARKHHARGTMDMELVRRWVVPVLVGVMFGSFADGILGGAVVKTVFGCLLILVSINMLASSRWNLKLVDHLPSAPWQVVMAFVVGFLASMLGIGGGTLMVPLLTLFGVVIHRAVSTSSIFGVIISIPATILYIVHGWGTPGLPPLSTGYVNWAAFIVMVPMTMGFAPLGVKLAYRLNVPQLKRAFAVFLCLVGIKMAFF